MYRRLLSVSVLVLLMSLTSLACAANGAPSSESTMKKCPAFGTFIMLDGFRGKFTVDGVEGVFKEHDLVNVTRRPKVVVRKVLEEGDAELARSWTLNKPLMPGCWRVVMTMPTEASGFMTVTAPRPGPDSDGKRAAKRGHFFTSSFSGDPIRNLLEHPYNLEVRRLNEAPRSFDITHLFSCPGVCIETGGRRADFMVNGDRLRVGEIWKFKGREVQMRISIPGFEEAWTTSVPLERGFWRMFIALRPWDGGAVALVVEKWDLGGIEGWVPVPADLVKVEEQRNGIVSNDD